MKPASLRRALLATTRFLALRREASLKRRRAFREGDRQARFLALRREASLKRGRDYVVPPLTLGGFLALRREASLKLAQGEQTVGARAVSSRFGARPH